jgi:hypothetical protein
MRLGIVWVTCVTLLAGCSTLSQDAAFSGQGNVAFSMVVSDGLEARDVENYALGFQRVDLSKSIFLSDSFEVTFSSAASLAGSEFKKPDELDSKFRFAGKAVKPGEYALIYKSTTSFYNSRTFINVNCYSLGAVLYRIKAGHINILPVVMARDSNGPSKTAIESQVRSVMRSYPNMSAPITFGEVIGGATFKSPSKEGIKKSCGKSGAHFSTATKQASQ